MYTVLEIVQTKNKFEKIDILAIKFAIEEVETAIKNYCNIEILPDGLKFICANMVNDLIRYQFSIENGGSLVQEKSANEPISKITVGETTMEFIGKESQYEKDKNSHSINVDSIIMNYKEQLQAYRNLL